MRRGIDSRTRRGQIAVMFTLMTPLLLALLGLAVDSCIKYLVQAKLSAAVDGAALGAGRLLGSDANTEEIAGEFLQANFPGWVAKPTPHCVHGYLGAYNCSATIHYTQPTITSNQISVSASVYEPTIFMGLLGYPYQIVPAVSVATRKDSRLVMVLDRSGSMTNTDKTTGKTVVSEVQGLASWLTNQLISGTDEAGLVVYDTTAVVGYPTYNNTGCITRPYSFDPTRCGGPDTSFASQGGTKCCDMLWAINKMAAGGNTNMAEALSLAYIELQKAHNRDFAKDGVDDRLNSIVFLTDGVPNMFAADLNNKAAQGTSAPLAGLPAVPSPGNSLKPYNKYCGGSGSNCSPCQYDPGDGSTGTAGHEMIGSIGIAGGLYQLAMYDQAPPPNGVAPKSTATMPWTLYWVERAGNYTVITPNTPTHSCNGFTGSQSTTSDMKDMAQIPPWDLFGNRTSPLNNGYIHSSMVGGGTPVYDGKTAYTPTQPTSSYQINIAAWNAVDNVANTIRSDANLKVTFFVVGYTGNGGTDEGLLLRVANTQTSSNYTASPNQQTGQYYRAADMADLQTAFKEIATSLLRLAQ